MGSIWGRSSSEEQYSRPIKNSFPGYTEPKNKIGAIDSPPSWVNNLISGHKSQKSKLLYRYKSGG